MSWGFCEEYGEPYDYEDTPRYWAQRDLEERIIEEEIEERARNEDRI